MVGTERSAKERKCGKKRIENELEVVSVEETEIGKERTHANENGASL
jgi:hypothetical protein